jgi:glycosyltransferase involved in cell wall biosynthesis
MAYQGLMPNRITIEASNIYFRGGFVLLEQLLEYCENNSLKTKVYLGYTDVYKYFIKKNYNNISLLRTNGPKTFLRYLRRRSNTLFFCNLPPFVKCQQSVLYIHNPLFIQSSAFVRGESLLFNLKKFFYYYWIKYFARKLDTVACQTEAVLKTLEENLGVESKLFPFYRTASPLKIPKEYEFCYVGSGAAHKNNMRLLEAVAQLSEGYRFRIVMTIENSESNIELIERINDINLRFGRTVVVNKGYVSFSEVAEIYSASRALIFPSLAETLGLPLIEGIQYGLKVLSSDLPFTYQVVENPIVFNPESVEAIRTIMENFLNGEFQDIIQHIIISNKLPELISLLTNYK